MQLNTLSPDIKIVLDSDGVVRQVATANEVSDESVNRWIGNSWGDTVSGIEPSALLELVLGTHVEDASPIFHLTQNFPSGLAAPFEYLVFHGIKSGEFIAIGRDLRQGAETPVWYRVSQDEVFPVGQVYDLSPDGIVVLDDLGQILHANQSFLDLAEEATLAPIIGRSLTRWIDSAVGDLKMQIDSLRLCESVRKFSTTIKGNLGGNTRVEVSAVMNSNPPPAFIVMYIRDVSKRLEISERSERLPEFLREIVGRPGEAPLKEIVSFTVGLVERHYIMAALEFADGNRTAAARILGVSRQGLYDKLARHRIDKHRKYS
ncbi:MAG TPA: helix-turn-helix domain-containing protein [Gammaproteobacteria bacterium]|nr:helix-turn-helix domain-containing protein [Gammaproteobacteria bacterium]